MPYAKYTPDEVATRGEQIYEDQIRSKVEEGNKGKFVIIDIESGEFEIDDEDLKATDRMLARRPSAVIYGLRVGFPTAYVMRGHLE